jgi:hypothetical protein
MKEVDILRDKERLRASERARESSDCHDTLTHLSPSRLAIVLQPAIAPATRRRNIGLKRKTTGGGGRCHTLRGGGEEEEAASS